MNGIRHFLPPLLVLALVPALAGGPGCRQPATPETAAAVDLLERLPPLTDVPYEEPGAPARRWRFNNGLPAGWAAGPEGVEVRLEDGGVRLVSPDGSPPWVEARFTVDAHRYFALLARVRPEVESSPRLYYAYDDPPYFHASNHVAAAADPELEWQTLSFTLPSPQGQHSPVRALRFYPGGRAARSPVLRALVLQPRQANFVGRTILARERLELGQDFRRCWRLVGAGTREVTLRLPEAGARLGFALGTLQAGKTGRLEVTVAEKGTGVGETVYRGPFPAPGEGWREARADLSPWRGREVTIRFRVVGPQRRAVRLIASPKVRPMGSGERPSVLLIVLDAQRADRLSPYGHNRFTTPHLARLAREGVLFTAANAPCSWTIPSTIATLTGTYTRGDRIARGPGERRMAEVVTLAERFSRAGYATGGFAANCLLSWDQGYADGFESWYMAPHRDVIPTAAELNRRALAWLRSRNGEATFCYVHYMDPHDPYDAPWPAPSPPPGPPTGGLGSEKGWREGDLWPLVIDGEQLGRAGVEMVRRNYDRGTAYADHQIGRLLRTLRQEGLLEQTVVLVTADHGEELHDRGYWSHGVTLHREVVRVPLILRLPRPGPEAGRVSRAPVSLVDVAPTLAALAGLPEAPGWSDGRSLLDPPDEERTIYATTSAHAPTRFAVLRPPWKYVWFDRGSLAGSPPETAQGRWLAAHGPPEEMLFDIEADPGERRNLAGRHPEVTAELRGLMETRLDGGGAGGTEERPPGEADLERLKALGYVQ